MVDKFILILIQFLWYFPWIFNELNFYSFALFKCEYALLSQMRGLTENVYHFRPKLLNWVERRMKETFLDKFRRDITETILVPVRVPMLTLSHFLRKGTVHRFTLCTEANEKHKQDFQRLTFCDFPFTVCFSHDNGKKRNTRLYNFDQESGSLASSWSHHRSVSDQILISCFIFRDYKWCQKRIFSWLGFHAYASIFDNELNSFWDQKLSWRK